MIGTNISQFFLRKEGEKEIKKEGMKGLCVMEVLSAITITLYYPQLLNNLALE